eukprot:jgi/Hompol1/6168/HPOL_002179-RA
MLGDYDISVIVSFSFFVLLVAIIVGLALKYDFASFGARYTGINASAATRIPQVLVICVDEHAEADILPPYEDHASGFERCNTVALEASASERPLACSTLEAPPPHY